MPGHGIQAPMKYILYQKHPRINIRVVTDLSRRFKATIILLTLFVIFGALFFFPKTEKVVVLAKIQKKSWFSIPVIAENTIALIISTDRGYFYVRGEFDSDGIRHIFKKLEIGKTYEISYFGPRCNAIYLYPFICSFKEIT